VAAVPLVNNKGIALVLTLWILAAMVVLAAGLAAMTRTETQIARNYSDAVRCRWAAEAGINGALPQINQLVTQNGTGNTYLGEDPYQLSPEDLNISLDPEVMFVVTVQDEAGKVNINTASSSVLQTLFGDESISDPIIDWRSPSTAVPTSEGAESSYYLGLPDPYQARNGPFQTLQELLLVKNVSASLLAQPFGDNGRTINDVITIYSTDSNTRINGQSRININTATQAALTSGLSDVLTTSQITNIVNQRQRAQFQSAAAILTVQGITSAEVQKIYDRLTTSTATTLPGLINVNSAPVEVLALIPGLDSGAAQEIVSYRESNGAFTDVGQLLGVSGLSTQDFQSAAPYLTVRSRVFKVTSVGLMLKTRTFVTITCIVQSDGTTATIKYWQE
jgi:general secretion pathway protein K